MVSKRHTSLHATQFQDLSSNLDEGIPKRSIFHATVPFYKLQSASSGEPNLPPCIHHVPKWLISEFVWLRTYFQTTWCSWDDPPPLECTHAGAPSGEKRAAQEEIIEEFLDGRLVAREQNKADWARDQKGSLKDD